MRPSIRTIAILLGMTVAASAQTGQQNSCDIQKFKAGYSSLVQAKRLNDVLRQAYSQNLKKIIADCERRQGILCEADTARSYDSFGTVAKNIDAIEHSIERLDINATKSQNLRLVVDIQDQVQSVIILLPRFVQAVPHRLSELDGAQNGLINLLIAVSNMATDMSECIEPLK